MNLIRFHKIIPKKITKIKQRLYITIKQKTKKNQKKPKNSELTVFAHFLDVCLALTKHGAVNRARPFER